MDFSVEQTSLIEVGIVRYRAISFSLTLKERGIYGGKGYPRSRPWTIEYIPLEFIHARYDTGYGIFGVLLDHECYNAIDHEVNADDRYRWYGLAVKWESPRFIPRRGGYASLTGGFINPSDALHYSLYAARALDTVAYPYRYYFQADARYDIAKAGRAIPYIRGNTALIIAKRPRVNRSCELGLMFVSDRVIMAPYIRYSYRNDIDRYGGKSARFVSAGAWCESVFDADDAARTPARSDDSPLTLFPDMHFMTSYGRHFRHTLYGNDAVCDLAFTIVKTHGISVYAESDLNHNSPPPSYYMFPKYIDYANTGGVSFESGSFGTVVSAGYSFRRSHLGDFENPYPEKYRAVFVTIERTRMNRDHRFNTLLRECDTGFIGEAGWRLSAERRFARKNNPYSWKFGGEAEWTIGSFHRFIAYTSPGINMLCGARRDICGSFETGIRFVNGMIFTIFCRYENDMIRVNESREREQSIYAGIRAER